MNIASREKQADKRKKIVFGVILHGFTGFDGLLWSFPLADILTFLVTVFFVVRTFREPGEKKPALQTAV